MKLTRVSRTTAIRVALRYAIIYAVITALGLGVLYWATSRYVDAQIQSGLKNSLNTLIQIDRQQGRAQLLSALQARPIIDPENRQYLMLSPPDGRPVVGDLNGWPEELKADGRVRNVWIDDELIPQKVYDKDGFWPMIATTLSDGSRLMIAHSVRQAENLQEFILSAMSIILLVIVGLTLILGWRMGLQMLQRVDLINNTAQQIRQGHLSSRIPDSGQNDEFDELAAHLNHMLEDIERLVTGMQEVTDNVAHDLRHPLSRLRNRLEITLLKTRSKSDYQQTLKDAVVDVEGMIRTFNALIEIAQAEAGSYRGDWQRLDLSALAEDISELYEANIEEGKQSFEANIEPGIFIEGNTHLLSQVMSNLLENARKYAGVGKKIQLHLTKNSQGIQLSVSDNGPGIPDEDKSRVIGRFVRLEPGRSSSGNGLGLSLVAAVAKLHGANLKLENNHPGLRVILGFCMSGPSGFHQISSYDLNCMACSD